MTEQEWLSANLGLVLMEAACRARIDENGEITEWWRAVAARVACLQRLGSDMPEGVRRWVRAATEYLDREDRQASAERLLDREEVYKAFRQAYAAAGPELRERLAVAQDAFRGTDYYAFEYYMLEQDESHLTYTGPIYAAESAAHCDIIRDIFGNPFRSVAFDPSWRTDTAMSLARQMYESRAFSLMPILADALQDAGCENADVLDHCRDPQDVHVRGCWVVDLVLGKA